MVGPEPVQGAQQERRPRALRAARAYSGFASRNRWGLLAALLAVTAVSLLPVPDLIGRITTNRAALQNQDEPVRKRFDEVVRKFGTTFVATVVMEGRDRDVLHRAADRIAGTLGAKAPAGAPAGDRCTDTRLAGLQVRDVLYKVDLEEFERRGIYYLSAEDLAKLGDALDAADRKPGESALPPLGGLEAAIDGVADGLANGDAGGDADPSKNAALVDRLAEALDKIREWLQEPYPQRRLGESAAPKLSPEDRRGVDEQGYLSEGTDPIRVFLFVRPLSDSEDEDVFRCFTRLVRAAVREGIAAAGGAASGPGGAAASGGDGGVRAMVTGMPAIVTDDMDVIRVDATRVTLISGAAILALLLLYFRSIRTTIALFLPLTIGICWTLGITAVVIGRLTVISAYFGGILFGLGIDYAIQFLARFDEERRAGRSPEESWAQALANTGGGVLTGATTTALAFYAIGLTEFEGFAELGIIAGTGIVSMFLSTLVVFPLLLFTVHRTRGRRVTLDMGMERAVRTRASRATVLVVSAVVVSLGIAALPYRSFDYDPINLLPGNAESVAGAKALLKTDFSQDTVIATAPNARQATALADRFEALSTTAGEGVVPARRACPDRPPTIARIESAERYARFLPEMSHDKAVAAMRIARHRDFLSRIRAEASAGVRARSPVDPGRTAEAVERIADDAGNLAFDFRGSDPNSPLTPALTRLAESATELAGKIRSGPAAEVRSGLEGFQEWLLREIESGLGIVLAGLDIEAIEVRALPAGLEDRFRSRDGTEHAVYVHPTGSVGDIGFLRCFIADLYSVDPDTTGFPATHLVFATMVESSFEHASAYAFVAVLLCLVFHTRSAWQTLTAMAPLLAGIGLVIGVQVAAGMPFNFVNVMALPVLLGTGVDYGVYLVHRHREHPDSADGLAATATAITLSALTTIIGFGTLLISDHQGMFSLGFSLTLGIAGCLAAAQLVVPVLIRLARRK